MSRPPDSSSTYLLPAVLTGLFLAALALRFWRLGQFNTLVFDEVFYVRFAVDYLRQQPFFDAHPPLSKYLIALGIALVNPLTQAFGLASNTEAGIWLSPWSYRWVSALAGACLPPLVALLAYRLSVRYRLQHRLIFSGVAGGLMLLEGLTLVESRFGLINIYWLLFGLLGQVGLLRAAGQRQRWMGLLGAGIAFGCAIATKWNGAGFLLGIYLLWGMSRLPRQFFWHRGVPSAIRQLTGSELLAYGGLVPLGAYALIWLPHLRLMGVSLLEIHGQLWQAHQFIGADANAHPYCSTWYSWPLLLRPVAYFYRAVTSTSEGLPPGEYVVQGLGNPILWWLSTAAILALLGRELSRWRKAARTGWVYSLRHPSSQPPAERSLADKYPDQDLQADPIAVFLLVNYAANWLPWAFVQRCTFLYHYMGALAFSVVAIAYLLTRWLIDDRKSSRQPALLLLGLIGLAFCFWLPVYLGLRLSPEALSWRWWLESWI